MGEYATYQGESIKIGTCEEMCYLRADQRHLISGYSFAGFLDSCRFRFPFPDEDQLEPGAFEDYNRGLRIPGWRLPTDWHEHSSVQFTSTAGYVLSIPCPEGVEGSEPGFGPVDVNGVAVHRNGFSGYPQIVQQRFIEGELGLVVMCGACGAKWRCSQDTAAEIAECFLNESEREEYRRELNDFGPAHSDRERTNLMEIASRILAGYAKEVEAIS